MAKICIWLSAFILFNLTGVTFAATVDINTADAATIAKEILGVGPKKAQAIVTYREQNGPFVTVDDLTKIKGISEKIVDSNRANITLGGASQVSAPVAPAKPVPPSVAPVTPAKPVPPSAAPMAPAKPVSPAAVSGKNAAPPATIPGTK
jgi:competence protein ComEA